MISVSRVLSVTALLAVASTGQAEQWLYYGGDAGGQKYSPLTQINATNVAQLEVAWQYSSGELARRPELQGKWAKVQMNPIRLPASAGGRLMICTPFGRVIALDPATGKERWVYEPETRVGGYATPEDPEGLKSPGFTNCRGVAYWADRSEAPPAFCGQRIFVATHDLRLMGSTHGRAKSGD